MFEGLHHSVLWGIVAVVLAIGEIIAPGVFLIWLALAAALTAGLTLLLPIGEAFQVLAFAIFTALSVSGGRLWYLARPVEPTDTMLNDKTARMMGRSVIVTETIIHGQGRVRVDDSSWQATGPDAEIGTHMMIAGVDGTTLIVAYPVKELS